MAKSPVFHCKCCGASMEPKKMRPVTTWSGLNETETHKDSIEAFPRDEWEELCNSCIRSIRSSNIDLSKNFDNDNTLYSSVYVDKKEVPDWFKTDQPERRLDVEFEYVDYVYNGLVND